MRYYHQSCVQLFPFNYSETLVSVLVMFSILPTRHTARRDGGMQGASRRRYTCCMVVSDQLLVSCGSVCNEETAKKIPIDAFSADPINDMKIHGLHRQHNSHLTTVSKTMSQCRSHFSPQRRNAVTRATSTIIPKNDYRCEAVETSRNARPIFRKVVELSRWSQS
ncbi:uncharacterized protein [Bombus flavifrons]|uniref:uncharacterized protein n=1 Tax=Bombus flavifrons TaxID=103934 RepID=UPI003704796D